MSCAALLAAIDDTRLTTVERVVFGNIVKGYQKRADIAKATGCAESSVPRAVRKLEVLGYLKREFHDGKPNTYTVLTPERAATDTGIPQDTGIAASRTGKRRGIARDAGVSPPADTGSAAIIDAEFVDNSAAHIEHGRARAQLTLNNYTSSELYPERAELTLAAVAAREAPPKVLNGRAAMMPTHELAAIIVEHVNSRWLDPDKSGTLHQSHGRIRAWMDAGADFDADILPTIAGVLGRSRRAPIQSWSYFDQAVREATAQRLASEAPMLIITPEEANTNDQSASTTLGNADIRRGKISPGSAHYLRSIAKREPDEQWRVEPHAGK